jgi:hypothetical protein
MIVTSLGVVEPMCSVVYWSQHSAKAQTTSHDVWMRSIITIYVMLHFLRLVNTAHCERAATSPFCCCSLTSAWQPHPDLLKYLPTYSVFDCMRLMIHLLLANACESYWSYLHLQNETVRQLFLLLLRLSSSPPPAQLRGMLTSTTIGCDARALSNKPFHANEHL